MFSIRQILHRLILVASYALGILIDWLITMGPVSWCLGCTAAFWLIVQPQTLLSAKVQQSCASYKEAEVPYWGFAYILWCNCEPPPQRCYNVDRLTPHNGCLGNNIIVKLKFLDYFKAIPLSNIWHKQSFCRVCTAVPKGQIIQILSLNTKSTPENMNTQSCEQNVQVWC